MTSTAPPSQACQPAGSRVAASRRAKTHRSTLAVGLCVATALASPLVQAAMINFDTVPDGMPINTFYPGVTFSEAVTGRSVFARAATAKSQPNVVSINQTGLQPYYARNGAVQAVFATPQNTVSIDTAAFRYPESLGTAVNRPYLQAFDASNRLLATVYFQGALPVSGSTGYETLRYTSATANIAKVLFSVSQNSGPVVYGYFDNLAYGSGSALPLRYDDFMPTKWLQSGQGSGVAVQQKNGKLEMVVDRAAVGSVFVGRYDSNCRLRGDFDVSVNYSLPAMQANSGVRLGLIIPGAGHIERSSMSSHDVMPAGEYYFGSVGNTGSAWVGTADSGATLRITRTGTAMALYFYNAATPGWQLLHSGSISTADMPMQLQTWSHDPYFDNRTVTVQFDDVVLSKGRLVGALCPTPTP